MVNVTIELTPEEEARLRAAASSRGVKLEEMAHRLITNQLPPAPASDPTLALLRSWDWEDATGDPEDIAARQREWQEFQQGVSSGLSLRTPEP